MVKNKMLNRLVSLLCALFLIASSVLVSYQTAYASVSITEAGSYFLRMLCSAAGIYFEHSEVGLVVDVLSQVAAQSDTINSKEFQERMDYVLSLSPADRIEETFSNAFLADLINGFRESTVNENGHGGGSISFPLGGDYGIPVVEITPEFLNDGIFLSYLTEPVYFYLVIARTSIGKYVPFKVALSDGVFSTVTNKPPIYVGERFGRYCSASSISESTYDNWVLDKRYYRVGKIDCSLEEYFASPDFVLGDFLDKVTVVNPERIWVDAFDDAALHAPAITAPITIPADVAAMEENAKAVAAADNVDALYKALAGAGIAVDVTIPDETDKPTDAEIPDEGTSTIGKSLSDILAAITGMADKVGAIPAQIENFFTIDTDAIGDAFMGLKDAFSSRFEVLKAFGTIFDNLSYTLKDTPPIIKFRVPPDLVRYFGSEEVVAMDLTAYADYCSLIRTAVQCLLWFGFALALLDEFDIKFNVA